MAIKTAIVPVAGLGTRLIPVTKSQPKEMLPVGRKPVVQYIVEDLINFGIERILFITGSNKTSIENYFDIHTELVNTLREKGKEDILAELQFDYTPTRYFFTRQRQLLGLGHAVLCGREFIGDDPFVVALGDSIIGLKAQNNLLQRMHACFQQTDCAAVVAFESVPRDEVARYGIAHPADDAPADMFRLQDVIEKPDPADAPSQLAIAARYIFKPQIFTALAQTSPGKGGEIQLTDAIRRLIQSGQTVYGVRLTADEQRYDIGNFASYFRAFVEFALADDKYGADLRAYLATLQEEQR